MSITYGWKIVRAYCVPKEGDMEEVVQYVDAVLSATDETATVTYPTNICFGPPDPANFTPFEQLTEQEMIGWCENVLSGQIFNEDSGLDYLTMYKNQLAERLAAIANPPVINPPLPWSN
jgi:hypothetical protein